MIKIGNCNTNCKVGEMAFGNPKKYVQLHIPDNEVDDYLKALAKANS
jgi:hypothetical protein